MAKATPKLEINTHTRVREVRETETVEEVTGVTLELTLEEARTLRTLTGAIRGGSEDTLRQYTDTVWAALEQAGVGRYGGYFGPYSNAVLEVVPTFKEGSHLAEVYDERLPKSVRVEETRPEVPEFKEGDYVEVLYVPHSGCPFYNKGDVGKVVETIAEGSYKVDFNNCGNATVFGGGQWFVSGARLKRVNGPNTPQLSVGSKIKVTEAVPPCAYKEGDTLIVISILGGCGVYAVEESRPYGPKHYLLNLEFEVIG